METGWITKETTEFLLEKALSGDNGTYPVSDLSKRVLNQEYDTVRKGTYPIITRRIRQSLKHFSSEGTVLTSEREDSTVQYRIVKDGAQFKAVLV